MDKQKGFKMSEYKVQEIELLDLLSLLWKKRFLIIVLALIFASISFYWVKSSTPLYESNGVLFVSNKEVNATPDPSLSVKTSDITASRSIVTSYLEILKTTDFLQIVSDDLGNRFSPSQIRSMLSLSSLNETELLLVRVVSDNPQTSFDVVSAVLKHAPETLINVFESGSAKVVDTPKLSHQPIDKSIVQKTFLGFFTGAVVGCILVLLLNFFDKKVHKASDLSKRYHISVLGEIRR